MRPIILGLACLAALPTLADTAAPDSAAYLDDRSSPAQVIASLYNAINRHEYLRGWSYFIDGGAADYPAFRDGYADTEQVELRMGDVVSDGAAGSIHSTVPVMIRATRGDGTQSVFAGCYRLVQVQPAIQDAPPFRPIQITGGTLVPSDAPFDGAIAACEP